MKIYSWLAVAVLIGALAACGNDDGGDGGSSTTDTASSSSGGADGSGSSGGTDGGGATDAGGEAACLSGPATPTGGWGTGCTSADDQKWFGDAKNAQGFPTMIRNCTLGGCAGAGDDAAIQKCIGDCIKEKSKTLSQDCSNCYGTWAGWCGFKKCISVCAVDDGTDKCDVCLACHCTPNRDACVAGDKK